MTGKPPEPPKTPEEAGPIKVGTVTIYPPGVKGPKSRNGALVILGARRPKPKGRA